MPEVMVAMFLLAITVIGFAGLQVRALSATNQASDRTQAMAIAQDMAERMRANRSAVAYTSAWDVSASTAVACETNTCTVEQMAKYDIRQISDLAAATLPNGQIARAQCPNRTNSCIYVSWNTTTPTIGTTATDCSTSTGLYMSFASDCVISEAY